MNLVILILLSLFCLGLFGIFLFFWGYSTARYRQHLKDRETARLVAEFKTQYDAMQALAKSAISALPKPLDNEGKEAEEVEEWPDTVM